MSDPSLPPAAVEITGLRRAVDPAASVKRMPRLPVTGIAVVVALIAATVVGAIVLQAAGAAGDGSGQRVLIAVGVIATLVAAALLVMRPLRSAARRSREAITSVTAALDTVVDGVITHLASIGYRVPEDAAVDWVTSPEPTATVPLVHDSVIAARWWRPADGDDRVFVEPYLRQDGVASALPVLAPLPPTSRSRG